MSSNSLFMLQDNLVKNPLAKLKQNYSPKQKTQGVFPFLHLLVTTTMPMASRICQKINQLDCYSLRAGTKPVVSTASKNGMLYSQEKKSFYCISFSTQICLLSKLKKKKLRTQKRTNNGMQSSLELIMCIQLYYSFLNGKLSAQLPNTISERRGDSE